MKLLSALFIDTKIISRTAGISLFVAAAHLSACSKTPEKKDVPADNPAQVANPAQPDPTDKEPANKPKPKPKPEPKPQPKPKPEPKPQPKPKPEPKPQPKPKPEPKPEPGNPANVGTPAWGATAERKAWSSAVRQVVVARLGDFDRARDKEVFCPGYSSANQAERVNCWVMLVAAISKFESNFHTGDSFREPDGNYSIGLLALSPNECPNARTQQALKNGVANLVCGTNKMAMLIARDGYIDGPEGRRGAASYWSTLRAPYKRWDASRKRYLNLGKRNQVTPLVRNYRGTKGRNGLVGNAMEEVSFLVDAEFVNGDEDGQEMERDFADKEHLELFDDRDFFEPR